MYVVFELHQDGDCYLKYLVKRIDLASVSIQEYCNIYPDKVILIQGKAYLNGDLVSLQHKLTSFCPRITIDFPEIVEKAKDLACRVETYSEDGDGKPVYTLDIYGNAYYICETDGTSFDLNDLINGYGSF